MGNVFGKNRHASSPSSSSSSAATGGGGGAKAGAANYAQPKTQLHSADTLSEQDRALLDLKRKKANLHAYSAKVDAMIANELTVAKELLRQDKKKLALLALKRKRYLETSIERLHGQINEIEQMCTSIEFAQISQQVFAALSAGNDALQRLNEQMRIEDVEKLMDDSADAVAYQQQISELLGGQLTAVDEASVLDMMNEMEKELASATTTSTAPEREPMPIQPVLSPTPEAAPAAGVASATPTLEDAIAQLPDAPIAPLRDAATFASASASASASAVPENEPDQPAVVLA